MDVTDLLSFAVKNKASDLHLSSGTPPMIRIDGELRHLDMPPVDKKSVEKLLYDIMTDAQRRDLEEFLETDFSFSVPNLCRFRVNVFNQDRGLSGAFRVIPDKILTLDELGAPPLFKEIANYPRGLVLVTGPTGSGKTTTCASFIDHINTSKYAHILTIEDPIEFLHTCKKSLINQREVHRDTQSFNAALRSALREDPDVVFVGEMRDLETVRLALTAAETGHLVFATLHTSSAAKTINRIIDVFPGDEKSVVRTMLSESLQAVIAQALVPKVNGGRVAALEIMTCTPAIRNLIRENKVPQIYSMLQAGQSHGMTTLEQHLQKLIQQQVITPEVAQSLMMNKDNI